MKRVLLICGLLMLLLVSNMFANYYYLHSFTTDTSPGPIAVDTSPTTTDCYYATFNSANCTIYYVPDFLTSTGTTDQRLIAGPIAFNATRGFQGIALDSSDNVFVSGDNGSGSGIFREYTPNPGKTLWTLDATFVPDNTVRYAGCALLNDNRIVASVTTAQPKVLSTTDGSSIADLPADTAYGREPTFNPANNDIYQGLNRGTASAQTLEIYKDGTPANPAGYTLDSTLLFSDDVGTLIARNHNGYDKENNRLIHIDVQNKDIEIYSVNTSQRGATSINTTPVETIDLDTILGTTVTSPFDVVHIRVSGTDYLLISDYDPTVSKIHVFGPVPTKAKSWMFY